MSIFPHDDLLAKEIESWKVFAESLRKEDRVIFNKMLNDCYGHIKAINIRGEPYSTYSVLLSIVITQQQMIDFLINHKK